MITIITVTKHLKSRIGKKTCSYCGGSMKIGMKIASLRKTKATRKYYHQGCAKQVGLI